MANYPDWYEKAVRELQEQHDGTNRAVWINGPNKI